MQKGSFAYMGINLITDDKFDTIVWLDHTVCASNEYIVHRIAIFRF